jgi:hypothetical protein
MFAKSMMYRVVVDVHNNIFQVAFIADNLPPETSLKQRSMTVETFVVIPGIGIEKM